MANKTSKKSAKVGRRGDKAAAKRVAAKAAKPRKAVAKSSARKPTKAAKPKLLSGGNPQIAKAYGDAPVQAYIAAMPGWKRDVGRRLDALIVRSRPRRVQGREVELAASTASRARAGSSASIASRSTSRWLSSAARRCVPFPPASPSKRKCATSTSTRTTRSTKLNSPLG